MGNWIVSGKGSKPDSLNGQFCVQTLRFFLKKEVFQLLYCRKNVYLCNKVYPLFPSQNTAIHSRHLINNTHVHTYFSKVVFFSYVKKYFTGRGHRVEGRLIPVGDSGVANSMEWGNQPTRSSLYPSFQSSGKSGISHSPASFPFLTLKSRQKVLSLFFFFHAPSPWVQEDCSKTHF